MAKRSTTSYSMTIDQHYRAYSKGAYSVWSSRDAQGKNGTVKGFLFNGRRKQRVMMTLIRSKSCVRASVSPSVHSSIHPIITISLFSPVVVGPLILFYFSSVPPPISYSTFSLSINLLVAFAKSIRAITASSCHHQHFMIQVWHWQFQRIDLFSNLMCF